MECDSKQYRVRVKGHLDHRWFAWFDDLTLHQEADGTTTIMARNVDQATLHGILERIRDLGATLLAVQCLDAKR
ncbi:MAG: hypothetical protein R3E79_48885 [Caldilineaceae bacterium]